MNLSDSQEIRSALDELIQYASSCAFLHKVSQLHEMSGVTDLLKWTSGDARQTSEKMILAMVAISVRYAVVKNNLTKHQALCAACASELTCDEKKPLLAEAEACINDIFAIASELPIALMRNFDEVSRLFKNFVLTHITPDHPSYETHMQALAMFDRPHNNAFTC